MFLLALGTAKEYPKELQHKTPSLNMCTKLGEKKDYLPRPLPFDLENSEGIPQKLSHHMPYPECHFTKRLLQVRGQRPQILPTKFM